MSINTKTTKNRRVKFGLFKSESEALQECEKRKPVFPPETTSFYVKKVERAKSGQNSWMAYCLIRKKGQ